MVLDVEDLMAPGEGHGQLGSKPSLEDHVISEREWSLLMATESSDATDSSSQEIREDSDEISEKEWTGLMGRIVGPSNQFVCIGIDETEWTELLLSEVNFDDETGVDESTEISELHWNSLLSEDDIDSSMEFIADCVSIDMKKTFMITCKSIIILFVP